MCFTILTRALAGRYVNFGVFPLYGDKALDHALEIFFQMMLSIPLDDMMVHMFRWSGVDQEQYERLLTAFISNCKF